MDRISIIPEDPEILCCRLQGRKTLYCLIRIGIALRIGIFRHTPDSLNSRITIYIFFYQIHVRAILCHGNIDHFNSKLLCNGKMSVISWYRAQKLNLIQLAPRGTAHYAKKHGSCNCIIHNIQTCIAAYDHLICRNAKHIANQLFCLRNAVQQSIVSAVNAAFCFQVCIRMNHIKKVPFHIKLCRRRLSTRHIKF